MTNALLFLVVSLSAHAKPEVKPAETRQIASEDFCQRLKRVGFVAFAGKQPDRTQLDYEYIGGQGRVDTVVRSIEKNSCASMTLRIRGNSLSLENKHVKNVEISLTPENAGIFNLRAGDSVDIYKEGDTLRINDIK